MSNLKFKLNAIYDELVSRNIHLAIGTPTRMYIHSGPFSNDAYYYCVYYQTDDTFDEEEIDILTTFNNVAMYPGENPRHYNKGEYRRFYRKPIDNSLPPDMIKTALQEYNTRKVP